MKLIIDIPEDLYNKLVKYKEFYTSTTIFSAITNGTPYNPTVNLTEAEKKICKMYLEDLDKTHTCNEYTLLMNLIDNAPTVEMPNWYKVYEDVKGTFERPQCNQIAWEQGYEAGVAQGKSERPQVDLISREALKEEVRKHVTGNNLDVFVAKNIMCLIDDAPTVETPTIYEFRGCDNCELERPKGEWKLDSVGVYCSECKLHPDYSSNFCPFCGADMRGEEDAKNSR